MANQKELNNIVLVSLSYRKSSSIKFQTIIFLEITYTISVFMLPTRLITVVCYKVGFFCDFLQYFVSYKVGNTKNSENIGLVPSDRHLIINVRLA